MRVLLFIKTALQGVLFVLLIVSVSTAFAAADHLHGKGHEGLAVSQHRAQDGAGQARSVARAKAELKRLELVYKQGGGMWQDLNRLGVLYLHERNYTESIKMLRQATLRKPGHQKAHESLGMAYFRNGEFDMAAKSWGRASEIAPQVAYLKMLVKTAREKSGLLKEAEKLKNDLKKPGAPFEKRRDLAILYARTGRLDLATFELLKAIEKNPEVAGLHDILARIYARIGDYKRAVATEKIAVKLSPDNETFRKTLAEMENLSSAIAKGEFHDRGGSEEKPTE